MARSRKFPNLSPEDTLAAQAAAIRCKLLSHDWDPDSDSLWIPAFGYGVAWRCHQCGGWRYDTHSPVDNELLCRSYDMPQWYTDLDKMSRAEWMTLWAQVYADDTRRDRSAPAYRLPGMRNSYQADKRR